MPVILHQRALFAGVIEDQPFYHPRLPIRASPRAARFAPSGQLRYDAVMPLPEAIRVRYTEEDAGYITTRPAVWQSFGPARKLPRCCVKFPIIPEGSQGVGIVPDTWFE